MKHLYFAYGMNTNLASMQERCPDARVLGPAELLDYDLEFAYHCNVRPSQNNNVPGLLWNITDQDLVSLDATEGYPYYYNRVLATVSYNKEIVNAVVYTMSGPTKIVPPSEYYATLVKQGYLENNINTAKLAIALNNSYQHFIY